MDDRRFNDGSYICLTINGDEVILDFYTSDGVCFGTVSEESGRLTIENYVTEDEAGLTAAKFLAVYERRA